ncbi:hypothetical protein DR64_754 [Paraburkholderia xenovorans LB400]|nr:Ref family recombination enhancement nuclease [Paraburkholderia xenovorans]AIP29846.1 hypothetical protein DR64_754 [Paraburkholderia xenovorans LB400]
MLTRKKPLVSRTPLKRSAPIGVRPSPGSSLTRTKVRVKSPVAAHPKHWAAKRRPSPTAIERRYMGYVAALCCAVCRRLGIEGTPAIVHHQRTGTGKMRASHYRTCPLCPLHHQGSGFGVHDMGRSQFADLYGFSEVDLVEETRGLLVEYLPAEERT